MNNPAAQQSVLSQAIQSVLLTACYYPDETGGYYAVSPTALEKLAEIAGYPLSKIRGNYGVDL